MKLFLKRILFYILSFTWGGIMSIIGGLVILCLLPFGKVHVYHGRIYAAVGEWWGGISLGCFFLCDMYAHNHPDDGTLSHEAGHGLQNCIWGPLFIFVIAIPSLIRSQYLNMKYYSKGIECPFDYDDIWFEGQATKWGKKYIATNIL